MNEINRQTQLSSSQSVNPLLLYVAEFWSGFQSGVDQVVMRVALSNSKQIYGWVPEKFRAETEGKNGTTDTDFGIPADLISAASLKETTVDNIFAFTRDPRITQTDRALAASLVERADQDATEPALRTEMLVAATDATLIITSGHPVLTDGTQLMQDLALKYERPFHLITFKENGTFSDLDIKATLNWLERVKPTRLNIGGPRESHSLICGYSISNATRILIDSLFKA